MKKVNAIIMAAGMSTRFVPISFEKPKALLMVKSEILIERQIRQLREAGIEEIIIVIGYLKEQFKYLEKKYGVILIENPYYQERNNHSTLYVARNYLGNSFICSGDNYFSQNVFLEKSDKSYYAATFENGKTEEWCLKLDDQNKIVKVTVGGENAWTMKGHAFFSEKFSKIIIPFLEQTMKESTSKNKFWENIFIEHMELFAMYAKKYEPGIIEEFDSLEELRNFDQKYITNTDCQIIEKICDENNCSEKELQCFEPIKKNGLVIGFTYILNNKRKKYLQEK